MKRWTNDEIKYLKYNYLNHNLPPSHFEEYFGRSWKSIQQKMFTLGCEYRRLNKIFSVNENYFDEIDSLDKAYFLGLIISDGNVSDKNFSICLHNQDKPILEVLCNYIEYTGGVKNIWLNKFDKEDKVERSVIRVHSIPLIEALKEYGVIKNKTFKTFVPNISPDLYGHLIRGIFDGDGCISKNKKGNYSFFITGTFELLDKIQDILVKNCELKKNKLIKHRNNETNNIYVLSYGGNKQIIKIYNFLYKDCEKLFIERKKLKFEELCKKY